MRKGYVTIFVSLILVVLLVLSLLVIHIADISSAKTKVVTATSSAVSSEMANYNRFIFDRYHILLLDKDGYGNGEAGIEESISDLLRNNLSDDYDIGSVEFAGSIGIIDDDYKEFKSQINQNFKYDAAAYTVDKIIEKVNGEDEPVDQETLNNIDEDVSSEEERIKAENSSAKDNEADTDNASNNDDVSNEDNESDKDKSSNEDNESNKDKSSKGDNESNEDNKPGSEEVEDPRDTLKAYTDAGIAGILLPLDAELSSNLVDYSVLVTGGAGVSQDKEINTGFNDLGKMKSDSRKGCGWGNALVTNSEAVLYGATYFNCLTDQKFDDTYLNLEMEYIVAGKNSDGANYKTVINEIMLIRFSFNVGYILTDAAKMAECEALAAALTVEFPVAQPVVKYLLAGCWAYIESVADVYLLVRGHKVPVLKGMDTWLTDFESLAHLDTLEEDSEDEKGLDYKEYLMILMALQGNKMYGRMLDVMQMNVTQPGQSGGDPDFRMKNAVTAISINAAVSYKGRNIEVHQENGY